MKTQASTGHLAIVREDATGPSFDAVSDLSLGLGSPSNLPARLFHQPVEHAILVLETQQLRQKAACKSREHAARSPCRGKVT